MVTHHLLRSLLGAALVVACALTTTVAAAQDIVELNAGWGRWYGENAVNFRSGSALGAAYVADAGWPVQVGADVRFARFGYNLPLGPLLLEAAELQVGAVARRFLRGPKSRIRPFISGKLGYTRLALDLGDLRLEQNGLYVGPALGALFPTGSRFSPLLAVEWLHYQYADTQLFLEEGSIPQSGGGAWRLSIRAGLTFNVDRRGRR